MIEQICSAAELRDLCSDKYQQALAEAKSEIRGGCFRSRGRWIRVMAGDVPVLENGMLEFDGTQRQLKQVLDEYLSNPIVTSIYIEGGIDWAASPRDMNDFNYDPWVAEWEVSIWKKD